MRYLNYSISSFVLFFILLLDAQVSTLFSSLLPLSFRFISHSIFLYFFWMSLRLNKWFAIVISLILGLFYDLYYLNSVGLALFIFPTLMVIYIRFNTVFFNGMWEYIFGNFLLVFIFEMSMFILARIFNLTSVLTIDFIVFSLLPTLLLNLFIYSIFYPIFRKIFI